MELLHNEYSKEVRRCYQSLLKKMNAWEKYRSLKKEFEKTLKVVGSYKASLDISFVFMDSKRYWNQIYIHLIDFT